MSIGSRRPRSNYVQTEWFCDNCKVKHFGNCPKIKVTLSTTKDHAPECSKGKCYCLTKDQDWLKILLEVYKAGMQAGWKEHEEFRNGTKTTFNNEIAIVPKSVEQAKANILKHVSEALEKSKNEHLMNKEFTTDYQNAFLNGVQALEISIRKSLNLDKGKT